MFIKKTVSLVILIFLLSTALSAQEKRIYQIGKNVYDKMCTHDIDLRNYSTIDELKNSIKNDNLCKPLKEDLVEALSTYLWEVKRAPEHVEAKEVIVVNKDEKCPICGMFVYKYPKWVAQIFYKESNLSFDGVKDLMKFYLKDKPTVEKILVTDYYSQKAIDAKTAYFVLGADIYGPMGSELIPFEHENDAKSFYMDHQGKKILKFEEITTQDIEKIDE
ncbi:MAG: nitrous oxide reductase accessory protein NosL [Sulfurimonas sp.]|jgi:nitrous oxide reductase accessory protein NosL